MTETIIVACLAALGAVVVLANFINRYSAEKFSYRPFNIRVLAFMALAFLLLLWGVGTYNAASSDNLNSIVLLVVAAIMYLGNAAYLVKRTNVPIGLVSSLL